MSENTKKKISLSEALEGLTVGEMRTIERHYGQEFGNGISGTDMTVAAVWAYERRAKAAGQGRPDWDDFDNWTFKQLHDYFAPEEIEIDPSDPETAEGKDGSLAA